MRSGGQGGRMSWRGGDLRKTCHGMALLLPSLNLNPKEQENGNTLKTSPVTNLEDQS
ncbi:hypothetical protein COLO4_33824 [Corchorus olitorius]|uniref:Uncharacterized protein n=1 Tax=Corchorus olitorius TaxID=93759 RepID=A0A1R3GR03_9ROSI|nr:hypothetical protein COLO4_33824 [Corchorus olitorius]